MIGYAASDAPRSKIATFLRSSNGGVLKPISTRVRSASAAFSPKMEVRFTEKATDQENRPPAKPSPSEKALDDAVDDSFPASDPPSQTDPDKGPKIPR